jgi:ADP-ribose pyrophosphatase
MEDDPAATRVTVKRRRLVFQNSRFDVYADHVSAGDLEVTDFLVVAPHTNRDDFLTGVVVVPVQSGSILLLKHYRHAVSSHVWEVPRGFVDVGEEASGAALRELSEEAGVVCPPEKLVDLGSFLPEPGVIRARVHVFAATSCVAGPEAKNDEIGIDGASWIPEQAVRQMLSDGSIDEGATSVALYRYFLALEDGRIG